MTVLAQPAQVTSSGGLTPLYAAVRARLALVALLFAAAAFGWAWTVREMRGMDNGPWTALGGFGWFVGVWVVMMAAMMVPSVAPTVALYSRMTKQRSAVLPYAFVAGYLLIWAAVGVVAYGAGALATQVIGSQLSWGSAGRSIAAATLLVAAVYELTPLKDVCLSKCRSPLGALLGSWRDGYAGAIRMGTKNGAWCAGCCWALMASLFALGVMSVPWMAAVAGLIAIEKTLPCRRVVTYGTAAILLVLGILVLAAPQAVPGLTIPAEHMHMQMPQMHMQMQMQMQM
jgi:predicted metal-binding membrane protein